jgi:hypothetical protein
VRHLHKQALSISKVEDVRRCGGRCSRIDLISLGPKKKDQWTMLSSINIAVVLWLSITCSSYSLCTHVIRGGSRALKISLCHTGCCDGASAPFAISETVLRKWTNPRESLMVWFSRTARMNPPHSRRVNCMSWIGGRVRQTSVRIYIF